MKTTLRKISYAAIAVTTLGLLGQGNVWAQAETQPAVAAPAAKSPLSTAKTIHVKAKFYAGNGSDELLTKPMFVMDIFAEKPGKLRMDVDAVFEVAPGREKPKRSLYLLDGTKEYEANGLQGTYTVADAPAAGARSRSQLIDMASMDFVLYPDSPKVASVPGVKKEVTTETVDGKKLECVTYTMPPRKGSDGSEFTTAERIYTDTETGLPYRRQSLFSGKDGKTRISLQTDFSDWQLDTEIPTTQFVWAVPEGFKAYEEPKLLANGTLAPNFTAYTPEGKPVKLSDLKGKIVILDFWATWCGPCQKSMPHLDKVYKQVKDKNVTVLAVCVWDEKAKYDKWVVDNKKKYTFPTVFDKAGRGANNIAGGLYKVTGIPTQYVIGKDGKIAGSTVGYYEDRFALEDTLKKLGIDVPRPTKQTAKK